MERVPRRSMPHDVQAASFGRVNKNPRSKDFSGEWKIVYASGNTGLTALDGKISKFTVTDGTYENECDSKIAGIFPGVRLSSCLGLQQYFCCMSNYCCCMVFRSRFSWHRMLGSCAICVCLPSLQQQVVVHHLNYTGADIEGLCPCVLHFHCNFTQRFSSESDP